MGECNPFKVLKEKATYEVNMEWPKATFHALEHEEALEELGLEEDLAGKP